MAGRSWRRRSRRRDSPPSEISALREFVYLDDVSVYSLLASRRGSIATEFTESQTASLQSEVGASTGVGLAGIAKADLSSRLEAARAQNSQVVRKAIVQSTFKELYELEQSNLQMRPLGHEHDPPKVRHDHAFESADRDLQPWVVPAEVLTRGGLIEVEVELAAEPIFSLSAVISSLVEMMNESDDLVRAAGATGQLDHVAGMARVIERLLVGLIPIRGRAIDFDVVELDDEKAWVVHHRVADQLSCEALARRPLFVVGVAEEALFWKDIRRVLFSNARFRVLCRLGRNGVHKTWTPVKLVQVLHDVVPELAEQLGSATEGLVADALTAAGDSGSIELARAELTHEAVRGYATRLAARHDSELSADDLAAVELCALHVPFETVDDRIGVLRQVTSVVEQRAKVTVDPAVAAELRGPYVQGRSVAPSDARGARPNQKFKDDRFLDVEFVAVYW